MTNGMDEWQWKMNEFMKCPPHPNSQAAYEARIEALEAALREMLELIEDGQPLHDDIAIRIARAALDQEAGK